MISYCFVSQSEKKKKCITSYLKTRRYPFKIERKNRKSTRSPPTGACQESSGWSATGGRPVGERWLVRHRRAPLRRAVVGPPLAGTPQESDGWSATGGRPSGERWLVRHWRAPLRRAVVCPPLAGKSLTLKKKQFDPPANLLTQCHFVLQAIHDGKHR